MSNITIGRLRGGFCVTWTDARTGKRRRYQLAARSRQEAEAEGRQRYLKETWEPGGETVTMIWDAYRGHLGAKPTGETMRYTGKAVLAHFGELRPAQITVQDCRDYADHRMEGGSKVGSVWTELGHLRSALRWAEKMRLIARAPHIELPSKPDSQVEPMDGDTLLRLIDGCATPHARLAVILLVTTGARIGAILDLTWNRVDFERGVVDLRLLDGVTRKGRAVVPMNRMARAALEASYKARLCDHVVEYGGKPIKSIRTAYETAKRNAGLPDVGLHQIRHSVAVRMIERGVPIEKVSQYLGHSNVQITMKVYARFMPEHMADAAEVMDLRPVRGVR